MLLFHQCHASNKVSRNITVTIQEETSSFGQLNKQNDIINTQKP